MISRIFTFLGLAAVLAHAQSKPENVYATSPAMQNEARATVALIERYHISKKTLAEIDANEVIKTFCETLDPAKLYFTQAEVDGFINRYGKSLDLYLVRGNLTPAFEIYSVFKEHVAERTQGAIAALNQKIDLNQPGTFPLDRQKGNWPADTKEADDLWGRRVRLDILSELLGEDQTTQKKKDAKNASVHETQVPEINEEKIAEALTKLKKRYEKTRTYLDFEPQEIEEFFLTAFSTQFDPHSTFFSQRTLEEFEITMRNMLCGIGATLSDEEGYCTVKEILPGGPLELNGKVKSGDRIIAVGQDEKGEMEDIVGLRLTKTISRIRGKQGTMVRLLIDPMDNSGRFTINLVRDQIKLVNQMASARCVEIPSGQRNINLGVIELPAFYGKNPDGTGSSPTKDVEELIGKLKKLNIKVLVMDLRKNGGGLLTEAIDLSGLFIKKGSVLQVRDSMGRIEDYRDENAKVAWDGPLIVLTSKLSASASEIFCGALKDHRRAVIVGDSTTHGKGSVQNIIELKRAFKDFDPKSAVKITIQKWYAPSGSSIQLKGVPADIIVPSVYSVLPVAESDLERPLAWDSIPPSLPKSDDDDSLSFKISPDLIQILKASSEKRQTELPEFLTLNRTIEWTKSRQVRKEISLSLPQRRQERADDLAFREQVRSELDKLAAQKYKTVEIKLDAAIEQEKSEGSDKASKIKRASRLRDPIEDEDWPDYDIQLMESVRIAADWAKLSEAAKAGSASQPMSSAR
jgi:carboxyl-terminal processing protease